MTVYKQGPSGQTLVDWRATGAEMIRELGHDPDKPLAIDWERMPDRRNNSNAESIGLQIMAQKNGHNNKQHEQLSL